MSEKMSRAEQPKLSPNTSANEEAFRIPANNSDFIADLRLPDDINELEALLARTNTPDTESEATAFMTNPGAFVTEDPIDVGAALDGRELAGHSSRQSWDEIKAEYAARQEILERRVLPDPALTTAEEVVTLKATAIPQRQSWDEIKAEYAARQAEIEQLIPATNLVTTINAPRVTREQLQDQEALQKQFEDNERRRLGLRDPHDSRVLAPTRNFFASNRASNAAEWDRQIDRLRETPAAPIKPGYTATVRLPETADDSYKKPKNAEPLNPYLFPRGQRLPPPIPLGMEPVKPKPSIFKRLKTEFLERFWYR
jgi:hypothetical protein